MKVSLKQAKELLLQGEVVAVPTETVYGLAASLKHESAIKKIFTLKGRPLKNPLIIHVASKEQVDPFVDSYPEFFFELSEAFWPGPLTLVIPVNIEKVPSLVRAGLLTAAFRVPHLEKTKQLLELVGPLVMPSANLSGKPSSTCQEHVEKDFGQQFPVIDANGCQHGLESTILIWQSSGWVIGRLGAISAEEIAKVLGYFPKLAHFSKQKPICPGQLYRHYAPLATLHLTQEITEKKGVVIGFSDRHYPNASFVYSLGKSTDPKQVAKQLYHLLRLLDSEEVKEASVDMRFPKEGLWQSIEERLKKAASNF